MKKRIAVLALCCLGFVVAVKVGLAQNDKSKRPSPSAQAKVDLSGGGTITIDYSSPKVKGRKIFGGLVPYSKIWRAGANEATTFVPTVDVVVGGQAIPAGSYTLFVVPAEDKWTLVISKKTGEWGTDYPGEGQDAARVDMKVKKLPALTEDFKISLDNAAAGATLTMAWENTSASVGIAKK